jgi:hypothetical protein
VRQCRGRLAWQAAIGYGQRALVETTMGRYKALIGPRLRVRGFAAQQTEAATGVAALNRMLEAARPKSVRLQAGHRIADRSQGPLARSRPPSSKCTNTLGKGIMFKFDEVTTLVARQPNIRLNGIDGLPVAGKSTLADHLAATLSGEQVYLDEFVTMEEQWPSRDQPSFPFDFIRYGEF